MMRDRRRTQEILTPIRSSGLTAITWTLLLITPVAAQLPVGRLNSVFPAGGQSGSNFTAKITNAADLDETKHFWFSHPGIRAVPASDGVAGSSEFYVSIDPSVPRGIYEFRAGGLFGLSNPRLFMVGTLTEIPEIEPNNERTEPTAIAVNQTANGQVFSSGDLDWFRFSGKANQRILIECDSRRIDSKLQPRIELIAPSGRRIARSRGDNVNDAFIDVTLPVDGFYLISVSDQTFAGSNEHVYRLTIHNRPHIDFVIPAAIPAGKRSTIKVFGRNLPGGKPVGETKSGQPLESVTATVIAPSDPSTLEAAEPIPSTGSDVDGFAWRLSDSNPVLIHFATAKPVVEAEPNDSTPQAVAIPIDITGQFQKQSDVDAFEFQAKKGTTYTIEVFGQRMGSPIDPWFVLDQVQKQAGGKETQKRVTTQDDSSANIGGNDFLTAHSDPTFRFQAPVDGRYRLTVRDRYGDSHGHAGLIYRVSIRETQPDFRLIAVSGRTPNAENQPFDPGSLCIRRGGTHEVLIFANRRDGFSNPIKVHATGLPAGVECKPVWLGENQTKATLVFTATEAAQVRHHEIRVVGEAIGGPPLRRPARAATISRRTGGASESRLSESLVLSVLPATPALQMTAGLHELHVNQSQQILVPIQAIKRHGFDANVNVSFIGQPKNTDVEAKPIPKGSSNGTFRLFLKDNVPPGTYTIIPRGKATIPFVRNPWKLERAKAAHTPFASALVTATKAVNDSKAVVAKEQARVAQTQKQLQTLTQRVATLASSIEADKKKIDTAKARIDQIRKSIREQQKTRSARQTAATALKSAAASVPDDRDLASQLKNALGLVATTDKAITAAEQQISVANKTIEGTKSQLVANMNAHKKASDELDSYPAILKLAEKRAADAVASLKSAETALAKANSEKVNADKALQTAQNEAKPTNVNVYEPATPIVLHVAKSPIKLTASIPNGGNLKPSQTLDAAVTIKRDGYDGPISLSLIDPVGSLVTATPVVVPEKATNAVLKLTANVDAAIGVRPNCVIRASFQQNRDFEVDVPIKLQVQE